MWEIKQEWHRIDLDWLLEPAKTQVITERYPRKLEEEFAGLDEQLDKSATGALRLAGLKSVIDLQGKLRVQRSGARQQWH